LRCCSSSRFYRFRPGCWRLYALALVAPQIAAALFLVIAVGGFVRTA